jgi:hypothetical protein
MANKEENLATAPDQVLRIDTDRAVWREIADEVVILDVPTTTYLNLNKSARVLWRRLDRGAMPTELAASYGIAQDEAANDVQDFLDALRVRSLLAPPSNGLGR